MAVGIDPSFYSGATTNSLTGGGGGGAYTTQLPGYKNTNTQYQFDDAFQNFLKGVIGNQVSGGAIPDFTMGALENFTKNPAAAAEFFPKLAEPLLQAQRNAQQQQVGGLTDLFRKAGGTANAPMQSGAFAQAGRQLMSDQAQQQQQLLASTYIPLTQQLSNNMLGGIRAGIDVPQATLSSLANLYNATNKPIATSEQSKFVNAGFEPTARALDPFGFFS